MISITKKDFNINDVVGDLQKEGVGAIVTFIGTVRDFAEGSKKGNEVKKIDVKEMVYESYEDMALSKMSKIREDALSNYDIDDMSIIHRVGVLKPSEKIVIIAVSAAHRKAAFSACEYTIEELKKIVPIWKKEVTQDGGYWVGGERKKEV
ncbi:MAG: molybdenum cofactor biosynthesis protein MoaE [Methanomassiliicoccales archaeon]|nr:MAG: molybdenum cofactor biosynthesis protein MoaE [Methanomassiliicoccales archaeon]